MILREGFLAVWWSLMPTYLLHNMTACHPLFVGDRLRGGCVHTPGSFAFGQRAIIFGYVCPIPRNLRVRSARRVQKTHIHKVTRMLYGELSLREYVANWWLRANTICRGRFWHSMDGSRWCGVCDVTPCVMRFIVVGLGLDGCVQLVKWRSLAEISRIIWFRGVVDLARSRVLSFNVTFSFFTYSVHRTDQQPTINKNPDIALFNLIAYKFPKST